MSTKPYSLSKTSYKAPARQRKWVCVHEKHFRLLQAHKSSHVITTLLVCLVNNCPYFNAIYFNTPDTPECLRVCVCYTHTYCLRADCLGLIVHPAYNARRKSSSFERKALTKASACSRRPVMPRTRWKTKPFSWRGSWRITRKTWKQGTQFTCFTRTKVQILTPEELL